MFIDFNTENEQVSSARVLILDHNTYRTISLKLLSFSKLNKFLLEDPCDMKVDYIKKYLERIQSSKIPDYDGSRRKKAHDMQYCSHHSGDIGHKFRICCLRKKYRLRKLKARRFTKIML